MTEQKVKPFTSMEKGLKEIVLRSEANAIRNPRDRAAFLDQCANYMLAPARYSKLVREIEKNDSLDRLNQFYQTYF
jgi:hypothetical protein